MILEEETSLNDVVSTTRMATGLMSSPGVDTEDSGEEGSKSSRERLAIMKVIEKMKAG